MSLHEADAVEFYTRPDRDSRFKVLFFVLKGHVCQPRVGAKRKPWENKVPNDCPERAGLRVPQADDLPLRG